MIIMIKKNDLIEIKYTGKFAEDDKIFDTTSKDIAKSNDLYSEKNDAQFKPLIVCVGQGQVIKGLDESFIDKKAGDKYNIEVPIENAFGKKDAKLIQLIPTSKFHKQQIRPMAGLQVNIDNSFGIIRSVSGGRVIVDFNHPFAGKDLKYEVEIKKIFEKVEEKLPLLTKTLFGIDSETKFDKDKNEAELTLKMPKEIGAAALNDDIKKVITEKLKEISGVEIKIKV